MGTWGGLTAAFMGKYVQLYYLFYGQEKKANTFINRTIDFALRKTHLGDYFGHDVSCSPQALKCSNETFMNRRADNDLFNSNSAPFIPPIK